MTGGSEDELWEGENLVYRCKNDTLVLNDDPDMVKVQCNNNISDKDDCNTPLLYLTT